MKNENRVKQIINAKQSYMSIYKSFDNAKSALNRRSKCFFIVLGDNGEYWIPAHNRMASWLKQAGYEYAI